MNASPGTLKTPAAWPGALILTAVYLVITACNLHLQPIENPDEPRYACAARDIVDGSGDWLVPTFNDEPRLKKPPLIYWSLAVCGIAGEALGAGLQHAFRWAPLLAGLATVLAVYGLGRRLAGQRVGFLAGLILTTTLYFNGKCRELNTDPLLTAALAGAWYFFVVALTALRRGPDRTPYGALLGMYVCLALACLAKGPFLTGVFFVAPAAAYLWWDRANAQAVMGGPRQLLLRTGLVWGAPFALALGMGWNLLLAGAGLGEQGGQVLVNENLMRFLGGVDHNKGLQMYPWFYYLQSLPGQFLPWALLWIPMLILAWRELGPRAKRLGIAVALLLGVALVLRLIGGARPEQNWRLGPYLGLAAGLLLWTALVVVWWARGQEGLASHTKFLCCAVGIPFLFMGLAGSKRDSYVLPIFPFLALWVAVVWERLWLARAGKHAALQRLWTIILGIVAVAGAAFPLVLAFSGPLGLDPYLPLAVREKVFAAVLAVFLAGAAAWAGYELKRGRRELAGVQVLMVAAAALLVFEALARPAKNRAEDKANFYASLELALEGQPLVWLGGSANEAVWYLDQPVKRLTSYAGLKEAFFARPGARLLVRDREYDGAPLLRAAVRELRQLRQRDKVYHLVVADPARTPDPALFLEAPNTLRDTE